uniref:Uncharacterized protein n=1 Tax=Janibacter limosus TaxID=53458 RepID=A0AC61U7D2_9MICO|nr:hypothetical protein [Janibacter limosus]
MHGGYFRPAIDRTHTRPMARALAQEGWLVVLAEYRRVPGDPNASTDDLTALDTHLRETGHDVAARVGHSAGGALVMWRALHQHLPPTRALALAPVADFDAAVADRLGSGAVRDWIGGDPHQSPDLYAPRPDPAHRSHRYRRNQSHCGATHLDPARGRRCDRPPSPDAGVVAHGAARCAPLRRHRPGLPALALGPGRIDLALNSPSAELIQR